MTFLGTPRERSRSQHILASLVAHLAAGLSLSLFTWTPIALLLPCATEAVAQKRQPVFAQGPALPLPNAGAQGHVPVRNGEWLSLDPNMSVAMHTGELWYRSTDVSIPAKGMALQVRRVYRSQVSYGGPFGWNGSHNWDQRVFVDAGVLKHLDGERIEVDSYVSIGGGLYECQTPGLYRKARLNGSNWEIRDRDGSIRSFRALSGSAPGSIASYADPFGNSITCGYNGAGKLTTLNDTVGRSITLAYNGNGVISSITDFGGRKFAYGYTGSDLTTATSPSITGTPQGPDGTSNDFPNGRTIAFNYNTVHNLRKVKYPREVASSSPWNITLTHSGDAVASATKDGATLTLTYGSSSHSGATSRTTLTDLRGFVTHYDSAATGQTLAMEQVTAGLHANDPASFVTTREFNSHGEHTKRIRPSGEVLAYFYDDANVDVFQHGSVIDHVVTPAAGAPGSNNNFGKTPIVDPIYQMLLTSSERGDKKYLDYQEAAPSQNGLQTLINNWDINTGTFDLSGLGDLNGDGVTDQIGGNVVRHDSKLITVGVPTPVTIIRYSTYDSFGRLLTTSAGEGSLRTMEYSADTNGGLMIAYTDDANPASSLANSGTAFWTKPSEVTHVEARTDYDRDQFGFITSMTNPRGIRETYTRNVLGEILTKIEGASADPTRLDTRLEKLQDTGYPQQVTPHYEVWHKFDANGNRVRSDIENIGSGMGDAWLTTTRVFDAYSRLDSVSREIEPSKGLTWTFDYDPEGRRTRVTRPKNDFDTWVYDERGLVLSYSAGASTPATASTVTYSYDLNSNMIVAEGPDDLDGDGKLDKHLQIFDGRDRLLRQIDPVGTETVQTYDNHDSSLGYLVLGQSDGPSLTDNNTTGNVSLARSTQSLDEMDRVVAERRQLFLPAGQSGSLPFSVQTKWLAETREYDRDNLTISHLDPEGRIKTYSYDGLMRKIHETDGEGNTYEREFDAGGLMVRETITESNPLGSSEVKTFHYLYDGLGRMIRTVDNAGHASFYGYDSRGNQTAETDSRGATGPDPFGQSSVSINSTGNPKRFIYDGLDRPVLSAKDSFQGGIATGVDPWLASFNPSTQSNGAIDSETSAYGYDDNNNVETIVLGSNKILSIDYDHQNRMVLKTFPDGSSTSFAYWKNGATKTKSMFDSSGSLFRRLEYTYDSAGRRLQEQVTAGATVGTTLKTFEYNGLDYPTQTVDNNGAGANATAVAVYDSLGRVLQEQQNGRVISTQLDDTGKLESIWFPNGRRINHTYDGMARLSTVKESNGVNIASFEYFGRHRVAQVDLGNGIRQDFSAPLAASGNPTGYDAAGRPQRLVHEVIGGATLSELRYTYDRNGGRTKTEKLISGAPSLADLFAYDSQERVVAATTDLPGGSAVDSLQRFTYQGDSNLAHFTVQSGGPVSVYNHVDNANFGYQSIASQAITHDVAGNKTSDQWMNYHFDAFDRLVRVNLRNLNGTDGQLVVSYGYDTAGRRVSKVDPLDGTTLYFLQDHRVIEERNSSNQLLAQYVHGANVDDVLQMRRDADSTIGMENYFFLTGPRLSVVALTGATGNVVERYAYDASGFVRFLEPDGSAALTGGAPRLKSAFDNPRLYQAREYDDEIAEAKLGAAMQGYVTEWTEPTGIYYYRARYYDPAEHRFISRDRFSPANNNSIDPSTLVMRMYEDGFIESPYVRGNNNPQTLDPYGNSYWVTGCVENLKGAGRWVKGKGAAAGRGIKTGAKWVAKKLPVVAGAISFTGGTALLLIEGTGMGYAECASAYVVDNLMVATLGVSKAVPSKITKAIQPDWCDAGILDVMFPAAAAPAPTTPGPTADGPAGPSSPGPAAGGPAQGPQGGPTSPGPSGPRAPGGSPSGPTTGPTTGGGDDDDGEEEEEEPKGPTSHDSAEDGFYLGKGQECNNVKGEEEDDKGTGGSQQAEPKTRKFGYLPNPSSELLAALQAEVRNRAVTVAFAVRETVEFTVTHADRVVQQGTAKPGALVEIADARGNNSSLYTLQLTTKDGRILETGTVRPSSSRSSLAQRALAGFGGKGKPMKQAVASLPKN